MPWIDELSSEVAEQIPEELRTNETLSRYNSIADLAKSHLEQRSAISQSIRIPSEEAGAEARQQFLDKLVNNAPEVMLKPQFENPEQSTEFYRTLGMPESPDKYSTPEDVQLPDEVEKQLREVLHKANLTDSQYKKVVEDFYTMDKTAKEAQKTSHEEGMTKLREQWGMTADERFAAAQRANDEYFPGREFESLSAKDIEGLYNVSKAVVGKGPQAAQQPKDTVSTLTPKEALARADEILNNPAYWDRSNPEQKHLINKRLEYLKMAGYSDSLDDFRAGASSG